MLLRSSCVENWEILGVLENIDTLESRDVMFWDTVSIRYNPGAAT